MRFILAFVALALAAPVAAQDPPPVNSCETIAIGQVATDPARLFLVLTDAGVVTSVRIRVHVLGEETHRLEQMHQRWRLQHITANCYAIPFQPTGLTGGATQYVVRAQALAEPSGAPPRASEWSAESNPFVLSATPMPTLAVPVVRVGS